MHHDSNDVRNYDAMMRTTVTLDPDVEALLRQAMAEKGLTFKQALNDAIRRGITPGRRKGAATFPTYRMGRPRLDLDKALQFAAALEDEELAAKSRRGA
jgi:hypothetical protein